LINPVSGQKDAVEIVNPQSGGDWTVYVTRERFDVTERPQLKFRYRVGSGVLVNLYVKVGGRWREIAWTGNMVTLPQRATGVKVPPKTDIPDMGLGADLYVGTNIGSIEGVATDAQWHTATFDLRATLKKAGLPTGVEALAFAAPDRDYLRCGIGGNHLGAKYEIADFDAPLVARVANSQ
jgi:hypothetical protein